MTLPALMLLSIWRILRWTFALGAVSFSAGFFGPMILTPEANQGPLLGILITGPLGLIAGLVVGFCREFLGRTPAPRRRSAAGGRREIRASGFRCSFGPAPWWSVALWASTVGGRCRVGKAVGRRP
jgi:hypothetical protein